MRETDRVIKITYVCEREYRKGVCVCLLVRKGKMKERDKERDSERQRKVMRSYLYSFVSFVVNDFLKLIYF